MIVFPPDLWYDMDLLWFFVEDEEGNLVKFLSKKDYLQKTEEEKREFRRRYGIRHIDMEYIVGGGL